MITYVFFKPAFDPHLHFYHFNLFFVLTYLGCVIKRKVFDNHVTTWP